MKSLISKKKGTAKATETAAAKDTLRRLKVAGLEIRAVKLTEVKPNPWNPNRMNDETFEKELLSITNNGFIDPIKVRELPDGTLEIVDGEHRWRAATKLGMKQIPAVNLGPIPDEQAKKLTIIANELRGAPEPVLLATLLKDLNQTIDAAALSAELPLSAVEIDSLIKSTSEFKWDEIETKLEETDDKAAANPPPVSLNLGGERKFQLGATRGNIPSRLVDALMTEFDRSALVVGSKNPEVVLGHWLTRLQSTLPMCDVATPPAPAQAKKKTSSLVKKKKADKAA